MKSYVSKLIFEHDTLLCMMKLECIIMFYWRHYTLIYKTKTIRYIKIWTHVYQKKMKKNWLKKSTTWYVESTKKDDEEIFLHILLYSTRCIFTFNNDVIHISAFFPQLILKLKLHFSSTNWVITLSKDEASSIDIRIYSWKGFKKIKNYPSAEAESRIPPRMFKL